MYGFETQINILMIAQEGKKLKLNDIYDYKKIFPLDFSILKIH